MPIKTLGKNLAEIEPDFPQAAIYQKRQEWAIGHSAQLTGDNLTVKAASEKFLRARFSSLGIELGDFPIVRETSRDVLRRFKSSRDGFREVGIILVANEYYPLKALAVEQGYTEEDATRMEAYLRQNTIMHELYHGTGTYDTIESTKHVGERVFMRHGARIQGSGEAWEEGLACLWATKMEEKLSTDALKGKEILKEMFRNEGLEECIIETIEDTFIEGRYPESLRLVLYLHDVAESEGIDIERLEEDMRVNGNITQLHHALEPLFGKAGLRLLFEATEDSARATVEQLKDLHKRTHKVNERG